jgi:hypothetical protein
MRKVAAGASLVDVLRNGSDDLQLDRPDLLGWTGRGQILLCHLLPPKAEVGGDVCDGGAAETGRDVMPADLRPSGMRSRVEAVTVLGSEVHPTDKRNAVVDDDRLLVVTVERPLEAVERTANARLLQLAGHLAYVAPRGAEERDRRAGPQENAHLDAARQVP